MSWFYMAMQREPVVMWSCFIGALGTHPRAFQSSQRRCPYAVQSGRGFLPIASPSRGSRGAHAQRRSARPSRRECIACRVASSPREDPRSGMSTCLVLRTAVVSLSWFPRLTTSSRFHLDRHRTARCGPPNPRVLREHENRAPTQPARGRQGAQRRQLMRARGGGERSRRRLVSNCT